MTDEEFEHFLDGRIDDHEPDDDYIKRGFPEIGLVTAQRDLATRQAYNFQELKTQLERLGFTDPTLVEGLQKMITDNESLQDIYTQQDGADFTLSYEKVKDVGYRMYCVDASMDIPNENNHQVMQYLKPDVPVATGIELLTLKLTVPSDRDPLMPLNLKETQQFIHELKSKTMNTQNLSYLQKNLLNLGFGEKLNGELEKNIQAKELDFILNTTQEYNKDKVDYALHFKRGDENGMYFFNKYDASLQNKDMQQTFFLNKGFGMTAKEAYNLMDGRAVHKQLTNLENEQYNAWVILDKENKNDYGNHKLKTFTDGWNYKPERALNKLDIVGINEPGERDKLMKSLEKGNRHQVTVVQNGKEVKISLEANPADHRVNIYNAKGIQQKLEDYKKPELKKEVSQKQTQQPKEELPGKKSRKQGAKLKV